MATLFINPTVLLNLLHKSLSAATALPVLIFQFFPLIFHISIQANPLHLLCFPVIKQFYLPFIHSPAVLH
jgi:hypothetical protein